MSEVVVTGGKIGVDALSRSRLGSTGDSFRLWIDKGRGKYRAIDISRDDLERTLKMIGGLLGGAHGKPPRAKQSPTGDTEKG